MHLWCFAVHYYWQVGWTSCLPYVFLNFSIFIPDSSFAIVSQLILLDPLLLFGISSSLFSYILYRKYGNKPEFGLINGVLLGLTTRLVIRYFLFC